jgi:hypothetical protein
MKMSEGSLPFVYFSQMFMNINTRKSYSESKQLLEARIFRLPLQS